MNTLKAFDATFGIHPVSLAIAALVNRIEFRRVHPRSEIYTSTYYNGRENVVCLKVVADNPFRNILFVIFGEDRKSDSMFVQHNIPESDSVSYMNPPFQGSGHFDENSYHSRSYFAYGNFNGVVDYVKELIQNHLDTVVAPE